MKKTLGIILVIVFGIMLSNNSLASRAIKSSEPQKFSDNLNYKKSMTFLNEVEIRTVVDSVTIVIPARTVGQLKEIRGDGKGGYNMFVINFILTNETTCSISFLRKDLVENRVKVLVKNNKGKEKIKKVIINPKTFVLRGKAKTLYRGREYLSIPSIPKDSENCALLCQQIE